MAKYRVTSPDGRAFEVTAPDDASEDDVLFYAQQNFESLKPQSSSVTDAVKSGIGAAWDAISSSQRKRSAANIILGNKLSHDNLEAQQREGTSEEIARQDRAAAELKAAQENSHNLAGDIGTDLIYGTLKVPGALATLADLPFMTTGVTPVRDTALYLGEKTGIQPGKWADAISKNAATYSMATNAAKEAVNRSWKDSGAEDLSVKLFDFAFGGKATKADLADAWTRADLVHVAKAYKDNPRAALSTVMQSAPSVLVGGVMSRGLMMFAERAGVKLSAETAGGIGEGLITAGQNTDQMLDHGVDPRRAAVAGLVSGATTGLIGAVSGKAATKLGLPDVNTVMAGGGAGARKLPLYKSLPASMLQEGLLEELPQSMQEQIWQNWAEKKPLGEGVLRSGVEGAIAGAAMAGGVHPFTTRGKRQQDDGTVPPAPASGDISASDVLGTPDGVYPEVTRNLPEQTEAEKALYTPKSLTALDRVAEIDKALPAATPEEAPALQAERDQITASWPKFIYGNPTTVTLPSGAKVAAHWAVVDASEPAASHDIYGNENPRYDKSLQPRERGNRHGYMMQVSKISQNLDPDLLFESPLAGTGAPTVRPDGPVVDGNGRESAIQAAYQANGVKAEALRTHVNANSANVGVDPAAIAHIKNPQFIRVIDHGQGIDYVEYSRQANGAIAARMSPSEQAKADAARIDSLDDLNPTESGDFSSSTSDRFVRRFMAKLVGTEQAGLIDAGGQLSQAGYSRIRNAVLAKAYGDSPVLLRMVESLDDTNRNISKALLRVAPAVAKAREAVGEGALHDADIIPDLMAAVEELADLKDKGVSVKEALAQAGLFGDKLSPEARTLLTFLDENIRSPRRIAEFIHAYLDALAAAGNPAQGSILGDTAAPTKGDLMAAARRTTNAEPTATAGRADAGNPADAQENQGQTQDAPRDQAGHGGDEASRADSAVTEAELATAADKSWEITGPEVRALLKQWVEAQGSKMLERIRAAAERLWLRKGQASTVDDANLLSALYESGAPIRDMLRSKADKDGKMTLYRGLRNSTRLDRSPTVESYTLSEWVARNFAGEDGEVVTVKVAIDDIITLANESEQELLVRTVSRKVGADDTAATPSGEWVAFGPERGGIGIPRADMPQVNGEHRGALIQFLEARGISDKTEEVAANTLKPTQAEYSPARVEKWAGKRGDRSVMASSDGYILDGHHQWVAALEAGEPVKVLRFDAPIKELMAATFQFPSVHRSEGATVTTPRQKARADIKEALGDLAEIASKHTRAAMLPENTPGLMPALIKLSSAVTVEVGYQIKDVVKRVKELLHADSRLKALWNKVGDDLYRKAAEQAATQQSIGRVNYLFAAAEARAGQQDLVGATAQKSDTPKVAMIDGRPYDMKRDNWKWPKPESFMPAAVVQRARELVKQFSAEKVDPVISAADRSEAESVLRPLIEKAERVAPAYQQAIIDMAQSLKLDFMVGPVKKLDRAVVKFVTDPYLMRDTANIRDILRSTIVVDSYADGQRVIDEIYKRFDVVEGRVKNRTDVEIKAKDWNGKSGYMATGYGGFLINVWMDGIQTEIQINTPEMIAAKQEEGHKLYEIERDAPEGGDLFVRVVAAQKAYYREASRAASSRKSASDLGIGSEKGRTDMGSKESPDSANLLPSGKTTKYGPGSLSKNLEPAGNLSGTFTSSTSNDIVAKSGEKVYTSSKDKSTGGANESHGADGTGGAEGKEPGAAQGTGGKRQAAGVRGGSGAGDQLSDRDADAGDRQQERVQAGAQDGHAEGGRDNQSGAKHGDRDGTRGNAGLPAGRDIPAKSGRNYAFGDDDLTYAGSWFVKARQNVAAVELLKKLEREGRQASRAEQAELAKFVGWGSSEMANSIFGKKLDAQLEALADYDEAIKILGDKPYLTNSNYHDYHVAFKVLQAKNPALNWYTAGNITRAMLDAAKPDAAVRKWGELRDRLKTALSEDEWKAASSSTQNAHYTSKPVVKSMLAALSKMGFKGGAILEPGAGIGVFPGLLDTETANNSIYTGIEMEPITGGILKQLFPDERILVESFIDSKLPENYYDVAIGNPPFAAFKVLADPKYAKLALPLHDYFFAKSLDSVKPGGLMMFVTSRYTMDKKGDKARAFMAERADLVGAIRLPQTAFMKNAGTEVVTDVLFFRKKVPGQGFAGAQAWAGLGEVKTEKGPALVNEYFAAHPEMVLGTHSKQGSMYGKDEYTVLPKEGDIDAQFAAAAENLPADIYTAGRGSAAEAAKVRDMDFNPKAKKEGGYYVTDAGVLMQREGGVGVRADAKAQKNAPILKDYVLLRDALKQAQFDQLNGGEWETSLAALRKAYAAFQKKHGRLHHNTTYMQKVKVEELDEDGVPTGNKIDDEEQRRRFPVIDAIRDDPDWTLAKALEDFNDETGEIKESKWLTERTLDKPAVADIQTPTDALLALLDSTGIVDIPAIAARIGMAEREVIESLGTLIYNDPVQGWVMADEYLSGNVKAKLAQAEEAAKSDKAMKRNVEALKSAQPAPKGAGDITPQIGMNWIPGDLYSQFLEETTGVTAKIEYSQRTHEWVVDTISGERSPLATVDWGVGDKAHAGWLMEKALSGSPIRITKSEPDGKGGTKQIFDQDRTESANEKAKALREEFKAWIFKDGQRADTLVRLYNDKFNTTVQRKFDGSHLSLPGMSRLLDIFAHVKRGAWRVIQTGNTYLAHAVGAGKTLEMVISAMEQKRLGRIKKPMIIVPGHMLQQFASEWQAAYPTARLMVADEKDFHTDNRRKFVSRVAMSDLDGVIMTHSSFKLLDLDPKFKQEMIKKELDFLRAAYEEAGGNLDDIGNKKAGRKDPKIKRIEAQISALEQQLAAAMSSKGKDKNVRFDEMGVDFLYVDEAHCLPHDTKVLTDKGWLDVGNIVEQNMCVNMLSVDTTTGALQWKPVTDWFTYAVKGSLFKIVHEQGEFVCTAAHKVWTKEAGYVRADHLTYDHTLEYLLGLPQDLYTFDERGARKEYKTLLKGMPNAGSAKDRPENYHLQGLRGPVHIQIEGAGQRFEAPVLLSAVRDGVAEQSGRCQGSVRSEDAAALPVSQQEGRKGPGIKRAHEGEQSNAQAGICGEDAGSVEGSNFPVSGRQWCDDQAAGIVGAVDWHGNGASDQYSAGEAAIRKPTALLQGGPSRSGAHAGGGSGRQDARIEEVEVPGQAENGRIGSARVVRVEILEQGSHGGSGIGSGKDSRVYDIEVADNHNYFAQGVLVSNSFRKLSFATNRQMKGIDSAGSQMAWDLYMKTRWLAQKNPTRFMVMSSGTPITNTTAELYTVQRFMNPQALADRGLESFDDWAALFGESATAIESTSSGKYEPVERFSKFINVGEMTQMFRDFADVLNEDHLAALLGNKRPKVMGGGRKSVITPKTEDYQNFQETVLIPRIAASKAWRPSFEQPNNPDPIININTDARLASIDMRFMDPTLPNDPNSKLNLLIDGVIRVYKENAGNIYYDKQSEAEKAAKAPPVEQAIRGATQMVFFESGFGKQVAINRGFNARAWLEKRLRDAGIPSSQIAFMEDYKKSSSKLKLFADVNKGKVRVLVGSSAAMGTGVNAQQRLIAMHHLDAPYVPAILEQREGRIVRQGNKNPEVQIYAYSMKGSFDENQWGTLARKKFFIEQALSGDPNIREIEDVGDVSQLEIAAALVAENPYVIQLAGAKSELERLMRLNRAHEEARARINDDYRNAERTIEYNEKALPKAEAVAARVKNLAGDMFAAKVGSKTYGNRKEWGEAALAKFKALSDKTTEGHVAVGEVSGFPMEFVGIVQRDPAGKAINYSTGLVIGDHGHQTSLAHDAGVDPVGMAMRATNFMVTIARKPVEMKRIIKEAQDKMDGLKPRLGAAFPLAEQMANKVKEVAALEKQMIEYGNSKPAPTSDRDELANPKTMLSRAPWYKSAVAAIIPAMGKVANKNGMISPMQAKMWLAARQNEGKLKQDELFWSGLTDWLDTQTGNVAVTDIERFVIENGVKVDEVVLGGVTKNQAAYDALKKYADEKGLYFDFNSPDRNGYLIRPAEDGSLSESDGAEVEHEGSAQKIADDVGLEYSSDRTEFSGYQLPGGDNYKELLLTLPTTEAPRLRELRDKMEGLLSSDGSAPVTDEYKKLYDEFERMGGTPRPPAFRSPHYDTPNILAHVRFNERVDSEGRKVLFLEELQADKGQEWQKIKRKIAKGTATKEDKARFDFLDKNFPFNGTKAWTALALKRMIAYASENGFEAIAWTTGEQQAERYDLSKQVREIEYEERPAKEYVGAKQYRLAVTAKDGSGVPSQGWMTLDEIEGFVGKEIAKKIEAGEGRKYRGRDGLILDGLDLKVGGEGMVGYYDGIVPQVARDVMKKVGGGSIVDITIERRANKLGDAKFEYFGPNATIAEIKPLVSVRNRAIPAMVQFQLSLIADAMRAGTEFKIAMATHGSVAAARVFGGEMRYVTPERIAMRQPGFVITAAMREAVAQQLPLFSRGAGHGMALRDLQAVADRVANGFKNLPRVHVMESPYALSTTDPSQKALRDFIEKQGAMEDAEGATHDGEIYLFASGMTDEARAEFVLAEHEVTHHGLRATMGKELDGALQHVLMFNAKVRKAAEELKTRNGLTSNIEAVEEVLADMPTAELAKLAGWRKVVQAVRNWLHKAGAKALAAKLDKWLKAGLSEQQQADLFVADLVGAAREWVKSGKGGVGTAMGGTRMAEQKLADDLAGQEKWLDREAKMRGYKNIDDLAEKAYPVFEKLADLWRKKHPSDALLSRKVGAGGTVRSAGIPSVGPKLSRASTTPPAGVRHSQTADEIIASKAATPRPLDALVKGITQGVRLDRLTGAVYDKGAFLLDRFTPETIKAGMVSDYGIPDSVVDERNIAKSHKVRLMRKGGALLEKISTLTRAESRVAYEWMNSADPQSAEFFRQQLPPESIAVLADIEKMIDGLSKEAVKLGQLDADAFARNRFAYLHRSYVNHTAELTKGEIASRGRAISILGEQYKHRGMNDAVPMARIKNIAPEWWGRKTQAGKADKGLIGEKFIRFDRRAPSGEGTQPMPGIGDRSKGRLLEVAYWPAGETVPAKYGAWDESGTWKVSDTEGDKLILWRDFTKQERVVLGEIDEARFAIAKTLYGMINDVENGKYLEWLAQNHAKKEGETIDGQIVKGLRNGSTKMLDTFKPGEWVRVPDTPIAGTKVKKYGALAGRYLPGPIWNDVRQMAGPYKPLGDVYASIHRAWKASKTALSPAVHMNNVMANFVMADWHDVTAGHIVKALKLMISKDAAASEVFARFSDSGGAIGTWSVNELQRDQMRPILDALEKEVGIAGNITGQVGVMYALQLAIKGRLPSAWDALKPSKPGQATVKAARAMMDLYEAEDQVFRLAAWLKAKEEGATDMAAGELARKSFLDYSINAPWVQMMRSTVLPFVAFTYRAVPMMLETAARKPWKLMKLGLVAAAINALGTMLSGGDDDDDRKLLPEEKSGRIWGITPKLIRMPWNDPNGSPVFLDVRRWIPVGDIFDTGQTHAALPILPSMQPGGPLAILAELMLNKQGFTGKPIILETDTPTETAQKLSDYLYKAFAPNIIALPGSYAFTSAMNAASGKTDSFGREQSLAQAVMSSVGIKLGSYPKDVLQLNAKREAQAKMMEIDRNITSLKREAMKHGITPEQFQSKATDQMAKKRKVMEDLQNRLSGQ